jgi:peptidoglycan/xylan/chitin deacetylase (PgdA/CDA1 family)
LDPSLGVDPVIGVIPKTEQVPVVEEFFELFKTPWEFYEPGRSYEVVVATADSIPEVNTRLLLLYGSQPKSTDTHNGTIVRSRHGGGCLDYTGIAVPIYGELGIFEEENGSIPCLAATPGVVGLRVETAGDTTIVRLGFDLFQEVQLLLSAGQRIEHAQIPTLDIHIGMLRNWILNEGIPLLEIPPAPAGHSFAVCLTHDIDFVGIRNHMFDHTMWGFLYRSSVGAIRNLFRRRISIGRLFEIWRAAASLPLVYLGWVRDFWCPFEWYLRVEKGLPATYFLIPFKRQSGEHVQGSHAARRATAYDVDDLHQWTAILRREGCELGVHGLDAWHSVEKGRAELAKIAEVTGESDIGIRIHWLLHNSSSASVLEESGYAYDSTAGYNETIGYRSGTTQVFRPLTAKTLLELPLHIQDGALFYPERLDLSEPEAEKRCKELIEKAGQFGGVLTVLWHDRSHGPERFWGDFYIDLVQVLKSSDAWFATAAQAVSWFRKRRNVRFERFGNANGVRAFPSRAGEEALPLMCLRVYRPPVAQDAQPCGEETCSFDDIPWNTMTTVGFNASLQRISEQPLGISVLEIR